MIPSPVRIVSSLLLPEIVCRDPRIRSSGHVIGSTNRGFAPAKCRIILRDVWDFKRAVASFLEEVLVIQAGALPGEPNRGDARR